MTVWRSSSKMNSAFFDLSAFFFKNGRHLLLHAVSTNVVRSKGIVEHRDLIPPHSERRNGRNDVCCFFCPVQLSKRDPPRLPYGDLVRAMDWGQAKPDSEACWHVTSHGLFCPIFQLYDIFHYKWKCKCI